MTTPPDATTANTPISADRRQALMAALIGMAFLSSLWALFQWGELLVARAGGTPFCSVDARFDCAAVWDSPVARNIHALTGLPVAGWGLIWGVLAFVLPLFALARPAALAHGGIPTALRLTAGIGVISVVGLAVASVVAGAVCIGCIGTYILVSAWAALAVVATRELHDVHVRRGLGWTLALTLVSWGLLLIPGMRTPRARDAVGRDAIAQAAAAASSATLGGGAGTAAAPISPGPFDGPPIGDAMKDAALTQLLAQMPPAALQTLSDLLADYAQMPQAASVPPGRAMSGAPDAAVVMSVWTDPLCPHCAEVHAILDEIIKIAPGALRVESHHFPLDGLCNPTVERKNDMGPARCAATKALVCLENQPERFHLAQKLIFENQADLTTEKLGDVLKPLVDVKTLEGCMASPETQRILDGDIRAGMENKLEGTPLILVNGKEAKPFGPLLYALTLTGGATQAKALGALPTPRPLPPHDHPH